MTEGVRDERIHFVGNTMIDSLVRLRSRIADVVLAALAGGTTPCVESAAP